MFLPPCWNSLDETTTNWITETFGNWLKSEFVSQMQYVVGLAA